MRVRPLTAVFAGRHEGALSDVALAFHRDCGLGEDAVSARRREDVAAMSRLGVLARHWDFGDAVYRRRPDGQWLCDHDRAMFDDDLPAEPRLARAVREAIEAVCAGVAPAVVLVSGADGGHRDHRIASDAALAVGRSGGAPVLLWEDLPYAVGRSPATGIGRPSPYAAPPHAWGRKWRAIAAYRSQVRMLWPEGVPWRALLHDHAVARGGGVPAELLWAA